MNIWLVRLINFSSIVIAAYCIKQIFSILFNREKEIIEMNLVLVKKFKTNRENGLLVFDDDDEAGAKAFPVGTEFFLMKYDTEDNVDDGSRILICEDQEFAIAIMEEELGEFVKTLALVPVEVEDK